MKGLIMNKLKKAVRHTYDVIENNTGKVVGVVATGVSSLATQAQAAIDTSATGDIATAIAANQTAGTNVGTMVIGTALAFAVIYIIIGMVKKH